MPVLIAEVHTYPFAKCTLACWYASPGTVIGASGSPSALERILITSIYHVLQSASRSDAILGAFEGANLVHEAE